MNIAILGYGKMGHAIHEEALQQGHCIVATIDNEEDWKEQAASLIHADVAIEFSQPDQAINNILRCFEHHLPIVVGTTGWYQHFEEIRQRCINEGQSLFYASNFSIGMNILFRLNEQLGTYAKQFGYSLKIDETHHIHKLDKPSGTAITIANQLLHNDSDYQSWHIEEDATPITSNDPHSIPIHVTREGEVFGIHSVTLQNDKDKVTLTHQAFNRQGFAQGAVKAAEFLVGKTGIFTMNDLFNTL